MHEGKISFNMQCVVLEREQGDIVALAVLASFVTEDGSYLVGFEVDIDEQNFSEDGPAIEIEMDLDNLAFSVYPYYNDGRTLIFRDFRSDKEWKRVSEYYQNNVVFSIADAIGINIAGLMN